MRTPTTHENFSREETVALGSERSFGIVIAIALGLLTALNWFHEGHAWPWLGLTAAFFAAGAFIYPAALKPLNWVWHKFGLMLHAIVNPIVMGLLFYVAVWPTAMVLRGMGKDPLRRKFEPDQESYWIPRRPPGPAAATMKDQF
jgi:saxitoxin biosynthesis operon SxtJ-like protein